MMQMEYIDITMSIATSILLTQLLRSTKNYLDNTMNTEHFNAECALFELVVSDSEEEMQDVERW